MRADENEIKMSETDTKKRVIHNFGCRLNALDGDYIESAMAQAGISNATIVNSCAVTAEAVRQARQTVRREARAHPERPVFVTGCAAQTNAEEFEAMPEVAKLIGNEEKLLPQSYVTETTNLVGDIMSLTKAKPRPVAPQQAAPVPLCKCKPVATIAALFALFRLGAEIRARHQLPMWCAIVSNWLPKAIRKLF